MRKSVLIFASTCLAVLVGAAEPARKPASNPASPPSQAKAVSKTAPAAKAAAKGPASVASAPAASPAAESLPPKPAPNPGVYEIAGPVTPASEIDRIVIAKLKKLGIEPALCSDAVFLRRAYMDMIGTLPTLEEAKAFLDDPDAENKRARLIDSLLERDEFPVYWSMKWGDILRIKAEFPVNLWPNAAQAYDRWVKESIAANKSYDQFARELLTSSGSNFRVGPVNFFRAIQDKTPEGIASAVALTLMGSRTDSWPDGKLAGMAVFFSEVGYKPSREWKEEFIFWDPNDAGVWDHYIAAQEEYERLKVIADAKAAVLKSRLASVKQISGSLAKAKTEASSNKPWRAAKQIAELEASLKKAKAAIAGAEEEEKAAAGAAQAALAVAEEAKSKTEAGNTSKSPKTGVFPDGTRVSLPPDRDPREAFADWLIRPENPWFTKNIVNRMWSWLLGRGIIHEPDDIREDNPPSHPELLAYLEKEMIASQYDMKRLYRLILNSKTYQFSSIPKSQKPEAEVNFASYLPRRLPAEVLIDNVNAITGTSDLYTSAIPEPFTYIPRDMPAIGLADGSIASSFLTLFGRSARATGMETERINDPQSSQMLHMLNSSHIREKIERGPKLTALLRVKKPVQEIAKDLYLTILSRYPTPEELRQIETYGGGKATISSTAWIDIAWALINSTEALYRH